MSVKQRKGRRHKADCHKVLRELSSYLDDEPRKDLYRRVSRHLETCSNCDDFVASLRQTITLCKHIAPSSLSPAAKARLRGQIMRAVAGA